MALRSSRCRAASLSLVSNFTAILRWVSSLSCGRASMKHSAPFSKRLATNFAAFLRLKTYAPLQSLRRLWHRAGWGWSSAEGARYSDTIWFCQSLQLTICACSGRLESLNSLSLLWAGLSDFGSPNSSVQFFGKTVALRDRVNPLLCSCPSRCWSSSHRIGAGHFLVILLHY